jgi:NAD-dependent SIR2 family protein deacetylase
MATVTGFRAADGQGFPVLCDAHGNNTAFRCLGCGGPVLATIRENQRGSEPGRPTECPACGSRYWVEADEGKQLLVIHRVP